MPDRCTATILIGDERLPMLDRCDLDVGHEGPHQAAMDACDPIGTLVWIGTHEPDNRSQGGGDNA